MILDRRCFARSALSLALLPFSPLLTQVTGCREEEPQFPPRLDRLAFGSCNRQDSGQQHWQTILQQDPQVFLWLGDCIYADGLTPNRRVMEYARVKESYEYRNLQRKMRVLGIWDDHDYGQNDMGMEYPWKRETQQVFLDFIDEPPFSKRREQEGIYTSYLVGASPQIVQVILLDLRYFKPKEGAGQNPLGEQQWAWLEAQLKAPGGALKIVASSLQVLTDDRSKETWASYPEARSRLLDLAKASSVPVLFLSGDRHFSEVSKYDRGEGFPVYECTSSGLTHSTEKRTANSYRLGDPALETNFGLLDLLWSDDQALTGVRFQARSPQSGEILLQQDLSFSS